MLPFHITKTDLGGVVGDLVVFIRDFDLAELDLEEFSLVLSESGIKITLIIVRSVSIVQSYETRRNERNLT